MVTMTRSILFLLTVISTVTCAARYGYALAQERQALPPNQRALVARDVSDSRDRDFSSSVESSGASEFHFADFPTLQQPKSQEPEPSLESSFEKSFEENEKFVSGDFEAALPPKLVPKKAFVNPNFVKPNFLKPEKKKISCPMLNPWHDAVAHPDSDPECGHGMPGWRAHSSCRCNFLVKDRDEFGCALKFFTRCKLDNLAVIETESLEATTEQPWTAQRQFSTLKFRPTTRPRPAPTTTTTQRPTTTKKLLADTTRRTVATTTRRPLTKTTTRRPTTTTTLFEQEFDDGEESGDDEGTGPGFDYIMGTRVVPDGAKDEPQVSLPEEFGPKTDDDEEEPQFLIGHRYKVHRK